jgi:hypothetical protein
MNRQFNVTPSLTSGTLYSKRSLVRPPPGNRIAILTTTEKSPSSEMEKLQAMLNFCGEHPSQNITTPLTIVVTKSNANEAFAICVASAAEYMSAIWKGDIHKPATGLERLVIGLAGLLAGKQHNLDLSEARVHKMRDVAKQFDANYDNIKNPTDVLLNEFTLGKEPTPSVDRTKKPSTISVNELKEPAGIVKLEATELRQAKTPILLKSSFEDESNKVEAISALMPEKATASFEPETTNKGKMQKAQVLHSVIHEVLLERELEKATLLDFYSSSSSSEGDKSSGDSDDTVSYDKTADNAVATDTQDSSEEEEGIELDDDSLDISNDFENILPESLELGWDKCICPRKRQSPLDSFMNEMNLTEKSKSYVRELAIRKALCPGFQYTTVAEAIEFISSIGFPVCKYDEDRYRVVLLSQYGSNSAKSATGSEFSGGTQRPHKNSTLVPAHTSNVYFSVPTSSYRMKKDWDDSYMLRGFYETETETQLLAGTEILFVNIMDVPFAGMPMLCGHSTNFAHLLWDRRDLELTYIFPCVGSINYFVTVKSLMRLLQLASARSKTKGQWYSNLRAKLQVSKSIQTLFEYCNMKCKLKALVEVLSDDVSYNNMVSAALAADIVSIISTPALLKALADGSAIENIRMNGRLDYAGNAVSAYLASIKGLISARSVPAKTPEVEPLVNAFKEIVTVAADYVDISEHISITSDLKKQVEDLRRQANVNADTIKSLEAEKAKTANWMAETKSKLLVTEKTLVAQTARAGAAEDRASKSEAKSLEFQKVIDERVKETENMAAQIKELKESQKACEKALTMANEYKTEVTNLRAKMEKLKTSGKTTPPKNNGDTNAKLLQLEDQLSKMSANLTECSSANERLKTENAALVSMNVRLEAELKDQLHKNEVRIVLEADKKIVEAKEHVIEPEIARATSSMLNNSLPLNRYYTYHDALTLPELHGTMSDAFVAKHTYDAMVPVVITVNPTSGDKEEWIISNASFKKYAVAYENRDRLVYLSPAANPTKLIKTTLGAAMCMRGTILPADKYSESPYSLYDMGPPDMQVAPNVRYFEFVTSGRTT